VQPTRCPPIAGLITNHASFAKIVGYDAWPQSAALSRGSEVLAGRVPRMVTIALQPLVSLIAGILILLVPRLLNYIVAVYLIVVGLLGLLR
jgi:Protein of unknown function (DUF3096)